MLRRVRSDDHKSAHLIEFDFFAKKCCISWDKYAIGHINYKLSVLQWCDTTSGARFETSCDGTDALRIKEVPQGDGTYFVNSNYGTLSISRVETNTVSGESYFVVRLCAGNNGTGGSASVNGVAKITSSHSTKNVRFEILPAA